MQKGQGALEYLLLIGGAVLVAGIVIVLILGVQSGSQGQTNSSFNNIMAREALAQCSTFCCTLLRGGTTASGTYTYSIPGGGTASLYCDMTTDQGGWTRVWLAPSASENEQPGTSAYIAGTAQIVASASEAMVGYVDSSNNITQAWKMAIPAYWQSNHPFNANCRADTVTATRISDGLRVTDILNYSYQNFGSLCSDPCLTNSGPYGRVCLRQGSSNGALDFPFYSGFTVGGTDFCTRSDQGYFTSQCSANKLFAIYVR